MRPCCVMLTIYSLHKKTTEQSRVMESAFCAMLDNPPNFPLWELSSIIFFAIPMVVMVILYGRMGVEIRYRSKQKAALGKYN